MKKMPEAPQGMETPLPMPEPGQPSGDGRENNVIEKMRTPDTESEHIPTSAERPKGRINMAIGKARQTILGNGSLPDEIRGIGKSYKEFYKVNIGSNLRCIRDLATLHPVKAAKEFAFGTTGNFGNIARIAASPVRLGYATGASVLSATTLPFKAAAGVAKGAVKSPLWVWGKMEAGVNKLSKIGNRINTWKPMHA